MILDASALLAFLNDEPGADQVLPLLPDALVSSVNHSEVLGKLIQSRMPPTHADEVLKRLAYRIKPFDHRQALRAAMLISQARRLGLSLGDRACLALAQTYRQPVVTADRVWAEVDLPVKVCLIR